jgi:hypothetical protein
MPSRLNRLLIALAVSVAVFSAACAQRQGPKPPELSSEKSEVTQTVQRLERIEATMAADLEELTTLEQKFFDEESAAWAPPFPLDVFKHASMSCLNAPYVETAPEPRVKEAADRLGISCAVPAARVFESRLDEAPSRREFGVRKLRQIDEMRSVRARLQARLRQIPAITQRTRNYLASRRAEARKLADELERRRPEYLKKDFEESMRRIEAYRARLDELETSIATVERSQARWSRDLGTVVDGLYKDLSRLGHG